MRRLDPIVERVLLQAGGVPVAEHSQKGTVLWLLPKLLPVPLLISIAGSGANCDALQHLFRHLLRYRRIIGEMPVYVSDPRQELVVHAEIRMEGDQSRLESLAPELWDTSHLTALAWACLSVEWLDPADVVIDLDETWELEDG